MFGGDDDGEMEDFGEVYPTENSNFFSTDFTNSAEFKNVQRLSSQTPAFVAPGTSTKSVFLQNQQNTDSEKFPNLLSNKRANQDSLNIHNDTLGVTPNTSGDSLAEKMLLDLIHNPSSKAKYVSVRQSLTARSFDTFERFQNSEIVDRDVFLNEHSSKYKEG